MAAAAMTALLVAVAPALPAHGGATGGDGSGGTVTVGASGGAGNSGAPGSGGSPSGGGGSGGSGWQCTSTYLTLNNEGGVPPGGPLPGAWYAVTCIDQATGAQTTQTEWISTASGGGVPPVDPYAVALQAEQSLVLPAPSVFRDPSGPAVVNLSTWLWIDPSIWHPESVSASAGPVTATAVAAPVSVTWVMGDGGTVNCDGPGTPYDAALPAAAQTTACSYRYLVSSAGQPSPDGNPDHAAFVASATVHWNVEWTAVGAPGGGPLPPLTTTTTTTIPVEQIESLDLAGAGTPSGAAPLLLVP
jgi:hypothetical protein